MLNKLLRSGVLLRSIGISLILAVLIYFFYPRLIFEIYGKDVPQLWTSDLSRMDFAQIHQKLGPPQEDLSVKGYQIWLEKHWWGAKILEVMSGSLCKPTEKPHIIVFSVYVKGWYNPAHQQIIFQAPPRGVSP